MILVWSLILCPLLGFSAAQRGHYIRPLVETHYPAVAPAYHGLPLYEELPAAPIVPRLYPTPALYQSHPPPPQLRTRKTNRLGDEGSKPTGHSPAATSSSGPSRTSPARSSEDDVEAPVEAPPQTHPILSYTNSMGNEGDYSYKFETADGMRKEETSVMTTLPDGKTARSVRGSYSYPTADGRTIRVDYVADEAGFRATTVTDGESNAGLGTSYRRMGERGFVYTYRAP